MQRAERFIQMPSPSAVLVLVAAVCAWAGCDSSGRLVPVEGIVKLDGQPLAGANVALSPARATDPGPFTAKTDADGRFSLGPLDDADSGASAGDYFVIITTVEVPQGANETTPPPKEREIVPADYRNGTLRFAVPDGGKTDVEFAMTSG